MTIKALTHVRSLHNGTISETRLRWHFEHRLNLGVQWPARLVATAEENFAVYLLGGQVQVMFDATPSSLPHIRAGKLRPLAVTTATRLEVLPDVPTVGDFVPGYEASSWLGFGAPSHR